MTQEDRELFGDGDPGPVPEAVESEPVPEGEGEAVAMLPISGAVLRSSGPAPMAAHTYAAVEFQRTMARERYGLARANPRRMEEVEAALMRECEDPELAAAALYAKPIGGNKFINGPSIRLAEAIFRSMGHMDSASVIPEEDEYRRRVAVAMVDYQTGAVRQQDFIIEKTVERAAPGNRRVLSSRRNSAQKTVYRVEATEDELLIKQGALTAKVRRNLIIDMTPRWLLNKALAKCAAVTAPRSKGLVASFAEVGVTREQLQAVLGLDLRKLTAEQKELLKAIYTGIKEGETTWEQVATQMKQGAGATDAAPKSGAEKARAALGVTGGESEASE